MPSTICESTSEETDPTCSGNSSVRPRLLQTGQIGRRASKWLSRKVCLAPNHDSRTARTDDSTNWAWDRPNASWVVGHIVEPRCRQSTDQYCSRTFGNQSRSTRHATGQHTWPSHVRDSSRWRSSDQHIRLPFNDGQRQRWVWDRRRDGSRGMNGCVAVRTTLQNVIPDAGCWHSHVNLLVWFR